MHRSAAGKSREEIVKQSREFGIQGEEEELDFENSSDYGADPFGIHNFSDYIPVGDAPEKIKKWKGQGATIYYLSSRRVRGEVEAIREVLEKFSFPDSGNLLFRGQNEDYKEVVEKLIPDILIEDDCESIGGRKEMTYAHLNSEVKSKVHSVAVREFGGIDRLPDDLNQLAKTK